MGAALRRLGRGAALRRLGWCAPAGGCLAFVVGLVPLRGPFGIRIKFGPTQANGLSEEQAIEEISPTDTVPRVGLLIFFEL